MADKIECPTHGEQSQTFVCSHLAGDSSGLGFNCDAPSDENPYPDAWCDNCELIRLEHGGWNEETGKLTKIALLCARCYERARIRNTRASVTLDDLAGLRWKCTTCENWHAGPCLDFFYAEPYYWTDENEKASKRAGLFPSWSKSRRKTFLNDDYCAIEGRDFFVRGNIYLPIIGAAESFCWGVWGSLSQQNFARVVAMHEDPKRIQMEPMFSWLSSRIEEYPETLNLKMYVHIQELGLRPKFRLEPTDHPLATEYYKGIAPERVREIMLRRLRDCGQV